MVGTNCFGEDNLDCVASYEQSDDGFAVITIANKLEHTKVIEEGFGAL